MFRFPLSFRDRKKSTCRAPCFAVALLLAVGFATIISSAFATDRTWTGTTNSDWEIGTNWSGGTKPVSTDNAVFTGNFTNQPALTTNTVTTGGLWMTGTPGQ